jgi:hypothetical protein
MILGGLLALVSSRPRAQMVQRHAVSGKGISRWSRWVPQVVASLMLVYALYPGKPHNYDVDLIVAGTGLVSIWRLRTGV